MSENVDWVKAQKIAEQVASKHRGRSLHEDLVQCALIAVWENWDKPEGLRYRIAQRRMVDEYRRLTKYRDTKKINHEILSFERLVEFGDELSDEMMVDTGVRFDDMIDLDDLLGRFEDDRQRQVAMAMLMGIPKKDIAKEILGRDAAVVSHTLTKLRKILADQA